MIDLSMLEELDPAALDGAVVDERSELSVVSRAVAAQFVEAVAAVAGEVLAGREELVLDRLPPMLDSLRSLSIASTDDEQLALVDELVAAHELYVSRRHRGVGRATYLDAMRSWVQRFAALVDDTGSGDALRALVEYDDEDVPLFQELEQIRGIGRRRLQRLYAARLTTAEVLATASPDDVASVTGLPRALAVEVVACAHKYQAQRPVRALTELQRTVRRTASVLPEMLQDDALRQSLLSALQELDNLYKTLKDPR